MDDEAQAAAKSGVGLKELHILSLLGQSENTVKHRGKLFIIFKMKVWSLKCVEVILFSVSKNMIFFQWVESQRFHPNNTQYLHCLIIKNMVFTQVYI